MKKLLPLSLFLWMLVGTTWAQSTCTSTITTFPYFEGFEGTTHGWTSTGTNSSWVIATPAKSIITGAGGGTKSWVTNATGNYNNSEDSYVYSPCFNFTGMTSPVVEMKIWWNSEGGWDGTVLQSSINNGATWQVVGAVGDPNNWFNSSSITGSPGGQSIGWAGSPGSGGWVTAKHALTGLGNQANVRFRFAFGSDGSVNSYDGFAFDNFLIYNTTVNDAGATVINTPTTPVTPGVTVPVTVSVKNFGTAPLTSAQIGFRLNNGTATTITHTFTTPLATNATSAPITIGNHTFAAGTYTIKAWTKTPNGTTDQLVYNDSTSVSVIACNALSGTLTINKNAPASATNFTSFASAVQAISNCGISGAVTFNVTNGPYNEKISIPAIPGASATNTVTFNGNGNTITSGISSTEGVITLNGSKYIRFNNLMITGDPNATAGAGVYLTNGAQNNNFVGNTISMNAGSTSVLYGIRLETGANTNNLFQNNIIKGGYYGVYNYGSSSTPANNNQYIGNQIRDPYYYGMYFYYGANNLVEGNDISRPTRTNSGSMYSMYFSTSSTGNTVSKNRIHNLFGGSPSASSVTVYCIYVSASSTAGSENVIKNNAIYDVLTNGSSVYAFYNSGGNGTHYLHNTVSLDYPNYTGTGTLRGMYFLSASTNVKFMNNNLSINAGNTGTKHAIYLSSTSISLQSNGNNLYVPNGFVGYYSANKTTLADWQAANTTTPYDVNSASADPLFVNLAGGNLRPNTVAIDNIGRSGQNVADDIAGATRSTTTPDPGAWEFTVPPNDVAVIAVSGPVPGCGQTTQETVTVTIRNFGSLTQTSIPVSYKVNGTAVGSGTWTGTLPPNGTANFTFTQKANLAARGTYDIEGTTNLASDQDNSNNSNTLTVANALLPNMPVALDFETPLGGLDATVVTTRKNSAITEAAAASKGTGSTKGMIMEGIDNTNWVVPVGLTNPWTNNPDNFSSIKMCLDATMPGNDSIFMTFDLKQLYKTTHYNTNFRVTVNGQQVPVYENGKLKTTLNPPFGGYDSLGAQWKAVKVDLTQFRNRGVIQIGLESSVKEGYQSSNGTANLIDNIQIFKVQGPTGIKENYLQNALVVYPNPSTGLFNLKVPASTKNYTVEVMDLTGKVVKQQTVKNNSGAEQLNLNNAAKGIYILKIASEGNVATRKLIVE